MKILVAAAFPPAFLQKLQDEGLPYTYYPVRQPEDLFPIIEDHEVLIVRTYPDVQLELIERATALRLVCRAGIGMDHIDTTYLEKKDIAVFNTKGANADSVGEHTVGMLLSLLHKISQADRSIRQYQWKREIHRGRELQALTVGIIGFGNTGRAVAQRLSAFGCKILAYDKYVQGFNTPYVQECSLEALYQNSQVISFHVPLTEETHNWADDSFFERVDHPFILLNLSRGKVVNIPSLIRALDKGKVIQAALDVLPNERFDTHSPEEKRMYEDLFSRENVLFTPHTGGWSVESRENIQRAILQRILHLKAIGS